MHEYTRLLTVILVYLICPHIISSDQHGKDEDSCDRNSFSCQAEPTIFWELNGLSQDDPKLIEAIKSKVLIPPSGKPLNLTERPTRKLLGAQYGQPFDVEEVLRLKNPKKTKTKRKGFFIEAGASCGERVKPNKLHNIYSIYVNGGLFSPVG